MAAFEEAVKGVRDALTVKRVFGDPVEKDGVTFIPVAAVGGGAGGGTQEQGEGEPAGSGGGLGVGAKPVGAYVIKDGSVEWRPAVDVVKAGMVGAFLLGFLALMATAKTVTHR